MSVDERLSGLLLRLKAVEALARGVAHDLNNALGIITSYTEFVESETAEITGVQEDLAEIRMATQRCERLSCRLVSLSKFQSLKSEAFDGGLVLQELKPLLRRILTENIELKIIVWEGEFPLDHGRRQFETILLNLTLEALLRMPEGGVLNLELSLLQGPAARACLECRFLPLLSPISRLVIREKGWGIERAGELARRMEWTLMESGDKDRRIRIEFPLHLMEDSL